MKRFEIQDILSQSAAGITYLALDRETGRKVVLRRFFPFGRYGGNGLTADALRAFTESCRQLAEIKHPALRAVIHGDADPDDGVPYLVTEWIDGQPLTSMLNGQAMEPAQVMDIARRALEASILISKALGKQAVWVDTSPNSIVVDHRDRGFTFWICPFKWLGTHAKHKDIGSIVTLAEGLAGWSSRLYSEQSGRGFGGWVKSMRHTPSIGLAEALTLLSTIADGAPPQQAPPQAKPHATRPVLAPVTMSATPTQPRSTVQLRAAEPSGPTVIKSATSGSGSAAVWLWVAAAIAIIAGGTVVVQKATTPSSNETAAQEAPPNTGAQDKPPAAPITQTDTRVPPPEVASNPPPQPTPQPTPQPNPVATVPVKAKAPVTQPAHAPKQQGRKEVILSPNDYNTSGKYRAGTIASVKGLVKSAQLVPAGSSLHNEPGLYISFSEPYDRKQIRVVIYPSTFESGAYKKNDGPARLQQEMQALVGKTVTFRGQIHRFRGKSKFEYILVSQKWQIKITP